MKILKTKWRLSPGITQGARGRRKGCWLLHKVNVWENATETQDSFGGFDTIKEARRFVAHLKRQPIDL